MGVTGPTRLASSDHRRDFELAGVPMHNYAMHKRLVEE